MKRILTAILAVAAIATAQSASADVAEAQEFAQYAWDAIGVFEWETASYFLEQAIEASDDACWDGYYGAHLQLAQQAVLEESQQLAPRDVYLHWGQGAAEIYEDCRN